MVQITAFALFALLLARVVRAPPGTWRLILGVAVAAALASQFLPAGHPFRRDVAQSTGTLLWIGLALLPVGAYALWIRRLRRRSGADAPQPVAHHPTGLVQIAEDRALAADTLAALETETVAALGGVTALSLGWRDTDGTLIGHIRLRPVAETAEIEALWVAPTHRRRSLGRRLVEAAGTEAQARGAQRLAVSPASWQAPEFFRRLGFATRAEHVLGHGLSRLRLEKALP